MIALLFGQTDQIYKDLKQSATLLDKVRRKIMESHLFCLVTFRIYIFDLFMLVSPCYLLLSTSIMHFSEVFWTTYTYFNIALIFSDTYQNAFFGRKR